MLPVNPPARLLMGPGPIDADPRVLRALSTPLVGQYDPWMTATMNETQALYRRVFGTQNDATLLVDGTSRAGIEAVLVSLLAPGDRVLVPVFGRFRTPARRDRRPCRCRSPHHPDRVGPGLHAVRDRVGHRPASGRRCWRSCRATPRPR
ncbi:hypothetical protein Q9Q99_07525 [Curtobacterium flaccumfaciens]|nr:hypothetical protein Q9Q99_07525 [Curtobacterium flaccumfaciens]